MKKTIMYAVCIFLFFSAFLYANTNPKNVANVNSKDKLGNDKYYFLYSHPFKEKTILLSTTKGDQFKRIKFNVGDIFSIQKDLNEDKIYMPTMHEAKLYTVDSLLKLEEQTLTDPYTFFIKDKELSISAYHVDISSNRLEINDSKYNQKYGLEFPTYLTYAIYDESYIYLCNDVPGAVNLTSLLRVIERKSGEEVKTVRINNNPQDITVFQNKIVLTTEEEMTVITIGTWEVEAIPYQFIIGIADRLNVRDKEHLLMTYIDDKEIAHIVTLNSSFEWIEDKNLEFPYTWALFQGDRLYILKQSELGEGNGGIFGEFDIHTFTKEAEILLPEESMKVQRFVVMD